MQICKKKCKNRVSHPKGGSRSAIRKALVLVHCVTPKSCLSSLLIGNECAQKKCFALLGITFIDPMFIRTKREGPTSGVQVDWDGEGNNSGGGIPAKVYSCRQHYIFSSKTSIFEKKTKQQSRNPVKAKDRPPVPCLQRGRVTALGTPSGRAPRIAAHHAGDGSVPRPVAR